MSRRRTRIFETGGDELSGGGDDGGDSSCSSAAEKTVEAIDVGLEESDVGLKKSEIFRLIWPTASEVESPETATALGSSRRRFLLGGSSISLGTRFEYVLNGGLEQRSGISVIRVRRGTGEMDLGLE